jgi:aminomethyltransferase
MAPFAGYEMPIQYPMGLKAEHLHTREAAGLFDVSHMGQLRIQARDAQLSTLAQALEQALPVDLSDWPSGQQRYSMLLNDAGGIEDDLMLVLLHGPAGAEIRMVVNAGNRDADFARLTALCPTLDIVWIDHALIALQGPQAESVLAAIDPAAAALRFMQAATLTLAGAECFTTRSGYTGEDGYEISVPLAAAESLVQTLLATPQVKPIGLGARDTLRLEAGLPLHGNDITPQTSPVEAGLNFAIPKSRRAGGAKAGGFPGATTVLAHFAQAPARKLIGLVSQESIPIRAHTPIADEQGRVVGEVSSGTVSPSLGHPIALAYVERAALDAGAPLVALVRDRKPSVRPSTLPFVPKRYKR